MQKVLLLLIFISTLCLVAQEEGNTNSEQEKMSSGDSIQSLNEDIKELLKKAKEEKLLPRMEMLLKIIELQSKLNSLATKIPPLGTIMAWHKHMKDKNGKVTTRKLPDGWVECNGKPANGYQIPDLNGRNLFIRGNNLSGEFEGDTLQGHSFRHFEITVVRAAEYDGTDVHPKMIKGGHHSFMWHPGKGDTKMVGDGKNGTPRISKETHPKNMSVVWIMRVK